MLFNHLTELVAPWFVFGPRRARLAAGLVMATFQLFLIASGNLSFLNWLTLVPVLACFDDAFLARVLPARLVRASARGAATAVPVRAQRLVAGGVLALVAVLSIAPVSQPAVRQAGDEHVVRPADLVNTYGAFGSVGRERDEIVLEGTDAAVPGDEADWRPYEFECKPGDPSAVPADRVPYHYRLDWLIWFAAMCAPGRVPVVGPPGLEAAARRPGLARASRERSLPRLATALRPGDPLSLPFRAPGRSGGAWWTRERLGTWMPPLSAHDGRLRRFLESYDWLGDDDPRPTRDGPARGRTSP